MRYNTEHEGERGPEMRSAGVRANDLPFLDSESGKKVEKSGEKLNKKKQRTSKQSSLASFSLLSIFFYFYIAFNQRAGSG